MYLFSIVPSSVTCFGIVNRFYYLFSVSSLRWEVLLQHIEKAFKKLSNTRWSAHHDSMKVLKENVEKTVV